MRIAHVCQQCLPSSHIHSWGCISFTLSCIITSIAYSVYTDLYDSSMLWQEHVQRHCGSMKQDIYVRVNQDFCLLFERHACM